MKILPGLLPTVGKTTAEARDFEAQLNAWTPLDVGLARAEETMQADSAASTPISRSLPTGSWRPTLRTSKRVRSRYRNFYDMAVNQQMTLREIIARTDRNIGHNAPVGTAAEVADVMQEWFQAGACDGWAITPTAVPESYDAVCDFLIPELQRRGLARTAYEGTTLRDHLGLERPTSPRRAPAPVAG